MSDSPTQRPRVAIVGGGLAGAAAAVALSQISARVTLFEARRQLGGRAASYREPASGELVDHCQHVSLGCCTNLDDFCRRTGLADAFRLDDTLHFFPPAGRPRALRASRWLPAPAHLAPALARLDYLSLGERLRVAQGLWRMARQADGGHEHDHEGEPTILEWLRRQGQSDRAIEQFWGVVLTSALGDTLDRVSPAAARKVFLDGFLASRGAYRLRVPLVPLAELFGRRLSAWLARRNVELLLGTRVEHVAADGERLRVSAAGGPLQAFEAVIVAAPWRRVARLLDPPLAECLPWLEAISAWPAAPITGVHLWFDRPLTDLPHAVIVGRLCQWLFNRGPARPPEDSRHVDRRPAPARSREETHYHQVVISASYDLSGRDKAEILEQVCAELRSVFPAASGARLLQGRVVTEPEAVFSWRPGFQRLRPPQRTAVRGLFVAGDWTDTGWPATMEGAVRSGYLAAEQVCRDLGRPRRFLAPDLPWGRISRWLFPC